MGTLATLVGMLGGTGVVVGVLALAPPSPARRTVAPGVSHRGRAPRRRALRRMEADLADLVEGTARGVRSGLSLPVAMADAGQRIGGPLAIETALIQRATDHGLPFTDAVDAWRRRWQASPPVHLAATVLVLAATAGGRAALALDGVAATLRERVELQREVRAQASQARASAAVMLALPPGFLVVSATIDPSVLGVLFGSPLGWACLVMGTGLDLAAAVWMHRIVQGVVP